MNIKSCRRGIENLVGESMRTPLYNPYLFAKTPKPSAQLLLKAIGPVQLAVLYCAFHICVLQLSVGGSAVEEGLGRLFLVRDANDRVMDGQRDWRL